MWINFILALVIFLILLVTSIFVVNRAFRDTKTAIGSHDVNIPKFRTEIEYEEYPDEVIIENKYDCNVNSLRKCRTDDSTTLYGCKELSVRCQHFDHDTEYMFNGNSKIIPKNEDPKEGYALAITHISDACNAYHGDMVLVSLTADSTEYMMICQCKNPGYIGNEHLLGACSTPFICNGKVDNINQPLNKINCQCQQNEKSIRYDDGLPVCKPMLVKEANELHNDWSYLVPWNSDRITSKDVFNPTIRDNLKTSKLLDTCRSSINDTTKEIKGGSYNDALKTCQFRDNGFPLVLGIFPETKHDLATVDGGLVTDTYDSIRVLDNVAGKRKINTITTRLLANNDTENLGKIAIVTNDRIGVNNTSQLHLTHDYTLLTPRCSGNWPTYNCSMEVGNCYTVDGLPFYNGREPPFGFWWNTEDWDRYEQYDKRVVSTKMYDGLTLDQKTMSAYSGVLSGSFLLAHKNSINSYSAFPFMSDKDIKEHRKVIT